MNRIEKLNDLLNNLSPHLCERVCLRATRAAESQAIVKGI